MCHNDRLMRYATLLLLIASVAFPLELEKVLSSPFANELTAGPGGRVAWVVNARGARNIFTAAPPDYQGRQLTQYGADDGVEVGQLKWLPDGSGILFTRGGDLEHLDSANPNPTNQAIVPGQAIHIAVLADRSVRKVADGHSPSVAANQITYLRNGQVWAVELKPDAKPAPLIAIRGAAGSVAVSPDGNSLALTSSRGDHSFVAVYNLSSKQLRYLDPSLDSDSSPVWSPDSKSVAFIRTPASSLQRRLGPAREAKHPWSIRVADVSTGQSRQVFQALPGRGSRFALNSGGTALLWGEGRLVFPWERDGWLHLYSVSTDGGEASLLTPGDFEVEHMSLAPDRRSVLYSSNQNDINLRHIWRTAVRPGSQPIAMTSGRGIEWSPTALDGNVVACLRADSKIAARAALIQDSKVRDLAPDLAPSDYPAQSLVEPEPVVFPAADGMIIHGQLFRPKGFEGRRPGVIFLHGGSRRQMLLGRHSMYYYSNTYAMNQYLASLGYVVLSVNYRSGIGYGLDFREATNYGLAGASEYNDVVGAGLYLRGRNDVVPNRIGLWGGSYGGYLTALGLARGSDLFKAGVDIHGVHDWTRLRRGIEDDPEAARLAYQSSPMASVATWKSPVLLIHGDDDRNVPFSESVRLVEALRDRKVHVEQLVFPDEIHDFLTHEHWLQAYRVMTDFFARML